MSKFCTTCGAELEDTAKYCVQCGSLAEMQTANTESVNEQQETKNEQQQNFSQEQPQNEQPNYGYAQGQYGYNSQNSQNYQSNYTQQGYGYQYQQQQRQNYNNGYYPPQKNIVQQLADKVKIQGIIWSVIAGLQYLIAIGTFISAMDSYYVNDSTVFYAFCVLVIAVLNTISFINDFKYCTEVVNSPIGIVRKYEPLGARVVNVIYNVIFGGFIGVAGSVYGFVLRNFVMQHKFEFIEIEKNFLEQ